MNRKQQNELTELCRNAMLERDNHRCQVSLSLNGIPENYRKCGGYLQMSHIHSKQRYKKLKWELDNVLTKCRSHHTWWHNEPNQSGSWFDRNFPNRSMRLKARTMIIEKIRYNKEFYLETKRRLME